MGQNCEHLQSAIREKNFGWRYNGEQPIIMNLKIPESPMTLPTVEVVGKTIAAAAGSTVITPAQLQNNVGIFKNDVVQYVTQLPGVVTVSGISSQYYVRGGGPDENLVLVDGMQIYNLSHAFGLLSFVDPLIVKVADFSVGGFQAEYGGRLSSVFDIQTIDGDKNEFKAKGTLDLISTDALVTGPLFADGNSSFVAFYRRPLFENALQKFYSLGLPFDYDDGFAKATIDYSRRGVYQCRVYNEWRPHPAAKHDSSRISHGATIPARFPGASSSAINSI